MKQYKTVIIVAALIATFALQCCNTRKPYIRYEGYIWGTTFHITYSSNVNLNDSIMEVMKGVDSVMSPFIKTSLVSRINDGTTTETNAMFRKLFNKSQFICTLSHGLYDPTMGPLIDMWGFGTTGHDLATPTRQQLDSARAYVGILECSIDSLGNITKKTPQTSFNFSSIAKGYGCDLVGAMLKRNGVDNYIVEIGGEVVVSGVSPRSAPWRVMVDAPIGDNDTIVHDGIAVIEMTSGGLATSGDYRNNRVMNNGTFATHIINPETCEPAQTNVLSVTVIANDCMEADGFATACSLMPLHEAEAMIDTVKGVEALFVTVDTVTGRWVLTPTPGFPPITR